MNDIVQIILTVAVVAAGFTAILLTVTLASEMLLAVLARLPASDRLVSANRKLN